MTRASSSPTAPSPMAARIAGLSAWTWPQLTQEWRRLYGTDPLVINRRFVEKRIAYR